MNKRQTVGVIGLGRFGSLVACILKDQFEVLAYSHSQATLAERAAKVGARPVDLTAAAGADIVIMAVPISQTEEMIKQVVPMMKTGGLLVDTCSVKVLPCQWLERYARVDIEIMGTHPMFGPVSTKFDPDSMAFTLKDLQIVLCPLRIEPVRLQSIRNFLDNLGLEVIVTTPEDHDEQNAVTLSLVHFLGRSLREAGIGRQRIYTPGFDNLLKIYEHTTNDDWQLFFDMNNYNPYADKVRQNFLSACQSVEAKILEQRGSQESASHLKK